MTKVDKIKEVRVLRHVKGLTLREICKRVNLSINTVRKIVNKDLTRFTYQREHTHQPVTGPIRDIIEEWIREDLCKRKKRRRTAIRMYDILKAAHGYTGGYRAIAQCVSDLREKIKPAKPEAYIPLVFESGEAFQFDWGEVESYVGDRKNKKVLQMAVAVLCHSRHFFPIVYPCQKQELMLDAHQRGFEYFGGVCRRGIYDNLKTAVKSLLKGHHRNLQERFEMFSSHYLFEPDFCNPARGNEKGRVENKIGYIKRNFFIPTPYFSCIEELNDRLLAFAISKSRNSPHPEIDGKSCYEVYEQEKESLIQLPGHRFECCRIGQGVVCPLSRVFFDNNRYSVPTEYVSQNVLVRGYADDVVISHEGMEIARHKRRYGKNENSYNPYHYLKALAKKPMAIRNGAPFKGWQLPEVFQKYRRLLNQGYKDGDIYFARTLILLKDWPIKHVVEAIKKSIVTGILGDSYILSLLRHKNNTPVEEHICIKIELSRYRARQRDLRDYDDILRLSSRKEEEVK